MGWWLQVIGMILALLGFLISPAENIFQSGKVFITNLFLGNLSQTHSGSGDNVAGDKIVNVTRVPFSQKQSIKTLPPGLGGIDYLNLDNVAILKHYFPSSSAKVTLLLDVVPTTLPDEHNKNSILEGAQYYNQSSETKYVFDKEKNNRHEIFVGGRNFIVSLLKIHELNIPNVPGALEYEFGISER